MNQGDKLSATILEVATLYSFQLTCQIQVSIFHSQLPLPARSKPAAAYIQHSC